MRTTLIRIALAGAGIAAMTAAGCVITDDECAATPEAVDGTAVLGPGGAATATLQTPPAAKSCHAAFYVVSGYTGDDRYDPTLPAPMVIASANAIGVLGEQPGLVGIFDAWTQVTDPDTGEVMWSATVSAGAKNIPATAVHYGIIADVAPGEPRPVQVDLSIEYTPAPAE